MPVQEGEDEKGKWIKWGSRGTKHYFLDKHSRARAVVEVEKDRKRIEYFKRKG